MSGHFIDVILPIPIQKTFTYSVTQSEYEFLKKGMRVAVSFGKTKMYTGLVFKLHRIPPETYDAKEILQILDDKPIVTESSIKTLGVDFHLLHVWLGRCVQGCITFCFFIRK